MGPTVGGAILGSSLGAEWNFYLFAAVGLAGSVFALLLPLTPAARAARSSSARGSGATASLAH